MIYLVRHGLDDERFIGGYSNISLTLTGIKQVEILRDFIAENNYTFNKIISSDIQRAKETAIILNQKLNLDIEYNPILRELDKGKLNGMDKEIAKIKYPEFVVVDDIFKVYPEGESMIEFYKRIKKNINKILELDDCLLVTHRGVINMLYYILNNIDLDMDKEKFGVTHASFHELNPKTKVIRKVEYKWEK